MTPLKRRRENDASSVHHGIISQLSGATWEGREDGHARLDHVSISLFPPHPRCFQVSLVELSRQCDRWVHQCLNSDVRGDSAVLHLGSVTSTRGSPLHVFDSRLM